MCVDDDVSESIDLKLSLMNSGAFRLSRQDQIC